MNKVQKIINALDSGPKTIEQISTETGIPHTTVKNNLHTIWRDNVISKRERENNQAIYILLTKRTILDLMPRL